MLVYGHRELEDEGESLLSPASMAERDAKGALALEVLCRCCRFLGVGGARIFIESRHRD